jgi:phosphate transport system protein
MRGGHQVAAKQGIDELKCEVVKMGTLVQEVLQKAITAMVDKNLELASEVIEADDLVDEMELAIEQKCYSLIALRQPMASDLRAIATALRIIVDLERMGDHAEALAEITIALIDEPYIKPLIDIPHMAKLCQEMLSEVLRAYARGDSNIVDSLISMERQVDALYDQIFRELLVYMMENAKNIAQATRLLLAAGHLERVADHITNIGEMVVYMVEGRRLDINRMSRQADAEPESPL